MESKIDNSNRSKDFQEMGLRQLREQAIFIGSSASELSLCIDTDNNSMTVCGGKEDIHNQKKQVTTINKGNAVFDPYLPDHIKTQYRVLEHGNVIYDAMLNQTNIGDNINKFYVIQALESKDGGKFMVYNRWGRVGMKGQDKLQGPYTSRESAILEFEAKFFAKTKNHWSKRKEFICHPKYYTWLEIAYDTEEESDVQEKSNSIVGLGLGSQPQVTKLDPPIAHFISLICHTNMMKQQVMGLGFNDEKLPLGKLSRSTILKGYDVLRKIADIIGQSDKGKLEQLSGYCSNTSNTARFMPSYNSDIKEFYTIIPHDFGFRRIREFIIDTHYKLKCKIEMVEALGKIEVAASLFKDDIYTQEDPLHSHYQCLRCELTPLEVNSTEFSMIESYIRNTGTETHYNIVIVQLFRASREGENELFKKFSHSKNRMLLWHGSLLKNWTGILSQGLRIAPPEAPSAGYSFGKGVYFSDMFSKSAAYCGANFAATDGVLALCEVALGDMNELLTMNGNADKLPKGKLSTKGVGRIAPDLSEAQVLEDGVIVPLGKPIEQPEPKGVCWENEYIVYNVDQIRIRYVIHVNFCYT